MSDNSNNNSNSNNSLFEGIKKLKIKNSKTKKKQQLKTVRFNNIRKNRSRQLIRTYHHKIPMGLENILARKSHKKGSLTIPKDLKEEEKEILRNSLKRFTKTKKEREQRILLYIDYLKQKRNFNETNNSAYFLSSEEKELLNSIEL